MFECDNCKYKNLSCDEFPCNECDVEDNDLFEPEKMTNADKIRSMSDEELAEFITNYDVCDICAYNKNVCTFENPCVTEFATAMTYEWLQSEVEE